MPTSRSNRTSRTGKRKGSEVPKSGKQRRLRQKKRRENERQETARGIARKKELERARLLAQAKRAGVLVEPDKLAPNNSYGQPSFVEAGFYSDIEFQCAECSSIETWTGKQQKWWYEVAQGPIYSFAKLCRTCRRREQARRNEQRRRTEEGLAKKRARGVKP